MRLVTPGRAIRAGIVAVLAFLLAAAPASAGDRLFATTDETSPRIVSFDSGSPGTYLTDKPITGLGGTESILGIDSRPRGGAIYVITSADKLYTVDPATGALALVATLSGGSFTPLGTDKYGVDFDPAADRLRVTGDNNKNLRVNPSSGNVTTDTNINPGGQGATGVAYSNNIPGATSTTEYAYGFFPDDWFIINPPNNGTLGLVSSTTGVTTDNAGRIGVDIAPSGVAYATHDDGGQKLYTVNVVTGLHTGAVPTGDFFTGLTASTANLAGVTATTQSVSESAGQATITILRQNPRGSLQLFALTDEGSATEGTDYNACCGPVTFADGEVLKTVTIPLLADAAQEPDETFDVTFSVLPANQDGTVIAPGTTVTIKDDDAPPPAPPDRDGDGVPDASDNCPTVANADQADGNGNGVGKACDLAEVPQLAPSGTVPQLVPATADSTRPALALTKLATRPRLAAFRKGVSFTVKPSEAVTLDVTLTAKPRRVTLAATGVVLAEIESRLTSTAARRVRLKPRARLLGKPKKAFKAVLRIVATDKAGNRTTTRRTITVRPDRKKRKKR